jgi:hypothetical protein
LVDRDLAGFVVDLEVEAVFEERPEHGAEHSLAGLGGAGAGFEGVAVGGEPGRGAFEGLEVEAGGEEQRVAADGEVGLADEEVDGPALDAEAGGGSGDAEAGAVRAAGVGLDGGGFELGLEKVEGQEEQHGDWTAAWGGEFPVA